MPKPYKQLFPACSVVYCSKNSTDKTQVSAFTDLFTALMLGDLQCVNVATVES